MIPKEIYNPKFDDFHGKPVVTWSESGHAPRVDVNILEQYQRWRSSRLPRDEPHPAFWETNGPAIARALGFCGAKALVFSYVTDRKVAYQWFGRAPRDSAGSPDWYCVCSVHAENVGGYGTRVFVTLPTDEAVAFTFRNDQMRSWLKPEAPPSDFVCAKCMTMFESKALLLDHRSCEEPGPDKRIGEGIE